MVATAGSETGEEILRALKVDAVFSHRGKGYVDFIRVSTVQGRIPKQGTLYLSSLSAIRRLAAG